jgi:hypothetical protein
MQTAKEQFMLGWKAVEKSVRKKNLLETLMPPSVLPASEKLIF